MPIRVQFKQNEDRPRVRKALGTERLASDGSKRWHRERNENAHHADHDEKLDQREGSHAKRDMGATEKLDRLWHKFLKDRMKHADR